MNIGKMRSRVTILQPSETRNDCNEIVKSFTSSGTAWAAVEPISGKELYKAHLISEDITYRVTMRYNSAITSETRLQFTEGSNTKTLEISSVINKNQASTELELLCKEVT